jgi:Zn-dependent protease/predicted transcriptional regulator
LNEQSDARNSRKSQLAIRKSAMRSFKIGSVAGIGVYLHWTFLLLLAGFFGLYLYQGDTVSAALVGVGLILALFTCVVLHELGHALTARAFEVPTRDITLYPIGGVARLQRIPEEPLKELWIALAGPAVNVVLAGLSLAALVAAGGTLQPALLMDPDAVNLPATLLWANLILAGFNMLPAFPMDGGRVLRALLAMRMEYARATETAATVGQGMAALFGLGGLVWWNPILIFIALFVYVGARQESKQAAMRSLTRGISVREAMETRFHTLAPDDELGAAIDELLAGAEQDFPVVQNGRLVGLLTRSELLEAVSQQSRSARVQDVLGGDCLTVKDSAMLQDVFARMRDADCRTVPVLRGERLVGLLTLENVGELMMIASAMRRGEGDASRLRQMLARRTS